VHGRGSEAGCSIHAVNAVRLTSQCIRTCMHIFRTEREMHHRASKQNDRERMEDIGRKKDRTERERRRKERMV
jgi:hypothetical protein